MAKKQKTVETAQINTNIEEGTVENTQESIVESTEIQAVETQPAEEKKSRKTATRDDVKARRAQVADAVFQAVANATKPLSRADISRGADGILGRPGDSTSWVDGGVALAAFIQGGVIEETKLEGKKKTLYRFHDPVEAETPADEDPAAE